MDRKANPCTDFYRYACGGWEKRNYIDDSEVFVLSYMEIGNENKRQLKEILENKEIKLNYSAVSIATSIRDLMCTVKALIWVRPQPHKPCSLLYFPPKHKRK
jgi:predicted metalloendopeptidase